MSEREVARVEGQHELEEAARTEEERAAQESKQRHRRRIHSEGRLTAGHLSVEPERLRAISKSIHVTTPSTIDRAAAIAIFADNVNSV